MVVGVGIRFYRSTDLRTRAWIHFVPASVRCALVQASASWCGLWARSCTVACGQCPYIRQYTSMKKASCGLGLSCTVARGQCPPQEATQVSPDAAEAWLLQLRALGSALVEGARVHEPWRRLRLRDPYEFTGPCSCKGVSAPRTSLSGRGPRA